MARQRLGQHFLRPDWRDEIARAIRLSPSGSGRQKESNSCWVEVGAGHGEMTEYLAGSGSEVYAVEVDPPLVARLRELRAKFPRLTVLPGDMLKIDLATLAAGKRLKIYGNLPYYITSPILHHLFQHASRIDEIHVVIQLEVALRLVARPGTRDYGYLSVLTQYFSQPHIALQLPPGAFAPPPEVGSALVSLRLPGENRELALPKSGPFLAFVKLCFAQKRKTLSNNLRGKVPTEKVKQALAELRLLTSARAEELSVAELAGLFRALELLWT